MGGASLAICAARVQAVYRKTLRKLASRYPRQTDSDEAGTIQLEPKSALTPTLSPRERESCRMLLDCGHRLVNVSAAGKTKKTMAEPTQENLALSFN